MLNHHSLITSACVVAALCLLTSTAAFAGNIRQKVVHACLEKNTEKTILAKGPLKLKLKCVDQSGVETEALITAESKRADTRLSRVKDVFRQSLGGPGTLYETFYFADLRAFCMTIGDTHSNSVFSSYGASHALVSDNGYGLSLHNGTIVCVNTPNCDCEITGLGTTYSFTPKDVLN